MNSIISSNNTDKVEFMSPSFFESFLEHRSWEPGWFADFRKASWQKLNSLPQNTLKDERWRFSPRARLSHSKFDKLSSNINSLTLESEKTSGLFFALLDQTILDNPNLLSQLPDAKGPELGSEDTFLLGSCFAESGFVLKTEKGINCDTPLTCNHVSPSEEQSLFQQNIISLDPFSQLTLIEYFDSSEKKSGGMLSNLSHIVLNEGAKLNRIIIQRINDQSTFKHLEKIELKKNAEFNSISLHLGGAQSRFESKGVIGGEGANFNNFSLTLGRNEQLFDQRTVQHHTAPNGTSNLLFKNALLDNSKSVFSGLIKVDPNAQNTDSFQTNRNLLLSSQAEADSLPGLEILANEVKCSHGATSSKIDEQELFYLQSRGISKKTAEKLIVLGFFEEIISKASSDDLIKALRNEVTNIFNL